MRNDEFPPQASEWSPGLSRREFLELAAAQLALMGLGGCVRGPREKIHPYVSAPETAAAGAGAEDLYYATARVCEGRLSGLLVKSFQGRPLKIEGNPLHPFNRGTASVWDQAWILSLYDPARTGEIFLNGKKAARADFDLELARARARIESAKGEGLVLLTEKSLSPTFRSQMKDLETRWPKLRWIEWEATEPDPSAGPEARARFDEAKVVVGFDADPFGSPDFPATAAGDFMRRRRAGDAQRLFVVEPTLSLTGAWARDRLALRASEIAAFAEELERHLAGAKEISKRFRHAEGFLKTMSSEIAKARGACVFLAGPQTSRALRDSVRRLNAAHAGRATTWLAPPEGSREGVGALGELAESLRAGAVDSLLAIGGNPVYASPAGLDLKRAFARAKFSARWSLVRDETSDACRWHLPLAHGLETWSDAEAGAGLLSIVQPLIAPLLNGETPHEIVAKLRGSADPSHALVRAHWEKRFGASFEDKWEKALRTGFLEVPAARAKAPRRESPPPARESASPSADTVEILLRPDPVLRDGRHAGNPWLQELPKPLTQITWDTAAIIGPDLASRHALQDGHFIEIASPQGKLRAPVIVQKSQAPSTVTLPFGGGRSRGGKVAEDAGFNAFAIWNGRESETGTIRALGDKHVFARTQPPDLPAPKTETGKPKTASLFPSTPVEIAGAPAWGMVIDLDACTGCGACTIACQSENNIPSVGREGVLRGRQMHWIRVDRYDSEDGAGALFQPIPCMHCEKAPCEPVCPVAATVHSSDGLNQMVYNRCVGTRYCSNNCPYKVRRFNFLEWNKNLGALEKMQKNPDVSVRSRGVMEKCTYCVQRIQGASNRARAENRDIRPGEVRTACQATCPAEAIQFGNLASPLETVSRWRKDERHFALLEELGTRPRTTYLAPRRRSP